MAVRIDVAEIFRHVAPGYRKRCAGHLSAAQLKAMSAIEVCRTPVLGGHMWHCDGCGHDHPLYNSCHNRRCPTCQGLAALKWSETREHDILPVPYFHIVFTLPREIAQIAFANRKVVFDILFRTTASTLKTIAADPRRSGLHAGGTAVLHTWNQQMLFHPHLHVVIPNAGFDVTTGMWRTGSATFFAPVKVLASLFRRLFLEELEKAHSRGLLVFHGTTARLANHAAFRDVIRKARGKDWVVYAKPPFRGPQQVFRYLSRYTHRIAISNSRILKFDGRTVTFRCRKPGQSERPRYGTITVSAEEFIRRFLLHVVPDGMHRIRYFGILANACRTRNLDIARKAMNAPADTDDDGDVRKDDPVIAPVPCPHCGATMVIVGVLTPSRRSHASRGPPRTP